MSSRTRAQLAVLAGCLALSAGLGAFGAASTEDSPVLADPAPPEVYASPVRLLDVLDRADIVSPLMRMTPVLSLGQLNDSRRELIFEETFDRTPAWTLAETDRVHDGVLDIDAHRQTPGYSFVLPVEAEAHYRLVQDADSEGADAVEVTAVELLSEAPGSGATPTTLAGRRLRSFQRGALRIHRPRPIDDRISSISFFTTPETRSVQLVVTANRHRDPASIAPVRRRFESIAFERWHPAPRQEIALVAGRAAVAGVNPPGIEQYGQFPPIESDDEETYSFARALYAPPGTVVQFEAVAIGSTSRLELDYSLARGPPSEARFIVRVHVDGRSETIFEDTFVAAPGAWGWRRADVDLSRWAGRMARIVFITQGSDRAHPVFANPRITVREQSDGRPRHVIVIAVDTLRADRLSGFGYHRRTSPALDVLFASSMRFDNTFAQSNWTCPSFASIFTGLSPSAHGVFGHSFESPLPDRLTTLAERFRRAGYDTRAIAFKTPLYNGGFEQGFDRAEIVPRREVTAADPAARAIAWLEQVREQRAFLFLHFNDPHQPFMPPAPFDTQFGEGPGALGIELPWEVPHGLTDERQRQLAHDLYDGSIAYMDHELGRFLSLLRERELYDEALIAFVSDHGEELWDHDHFGHGGRHLFDGLTHVPLAIHPPASAGLLPRAIATQVRVFDLAPTLLELAGVPFEPSEMEARSLVPLFAREGEEREVFSESSRSTVSLRADGFKYIVAFGRRPSEALFNLADDPAERNDLAASEPARLHAMRVRTLDYVLTRRPGPYLVSNWANSARGTPFFTSEELSIMRVDNRDGATPYRSGDIERMLAGSPATTRLFASPLRRGSWQPAELETIRAIDAQALEELRALGYID